MRQASKGFSTKATGRRLRWRVEWLYKEGITMKSGHWMRAGRKKKNTLYLDKFELI